MKAIQCSVREVKNPPLLSTEHVFQTALVGHTINTKISTVLSNNIMEKEYHMK